MNERSPALLVSVRDALEARAALDGGCDILDIKEPERGSLGRADFAQTQSIITLACGFAALHGEPRSTGSIPISAALGEALDWLDAKAPPQIPSGLTYIKIGTAGLGQSASWPHDWRMAFSQLSCAGNAPRLIIVANADWRPAEGPSPRAVIEAATDLGCDGVLIDTHRKDGRGLFDWLTMSELIELALLARQSKLQFALAGSLTLADVPRLLEISPDIAGIRTAACRDGERNGPIDADAVRQFRNVLFGMSLEDRSTRV